MNLNDLKKDVAHDEYDLYITLLRNASRHQASLKILNDVEQLMAAPYDAEYLATWIDYTRKYHSQCLTQIKTRADQILSEKP